MIRCEAWTENSLTWTDRYRHASVQHQPGGAKGVERAFQMKRELEQTLQDSRSLTDQLNRDANSQVSRARQAAEQGECRAGHSSAIDVGPLVAVSL